MYFSIFTFLKKRDIVKFIRILMVGKLKLLLLSVLFAGTYAFSQSGLGTLKGTIKDESSGQPIELSKVLLKQGDQIKSGAIIEGNTTNEQINIYNEIDRLRVYNYQQKVAFKTIL